MRRWDHAEDYEFTESLKPSGWAWEFLRRNEEYRREYRVWLPEFQAVQEDGYLPSIPRDPNHRRFRIVHESAALRVVKKWGMLAFLNPDQDTPVPLQFFPPTYSTGLVHGLGREGAPRDIGSSYRIELELRPGRVATQFDLSQALKPQFDRAFDYFKWHQKWLSQEGWLKVRRPNLRSDHWSLYLRLLDAKAASVSTYDTGKVLLPGIFKGVKRPPEKRIRRNRELVASQAREAEKRKRALRAVRDRLRKARDLTEPARYLQIAASAL